MDIFWVVQCVVVRHNGDRRSGIDDELLVFSVYFYFDTVVVVIVRYYFVDSCDLEYFFGFAVFVFFFGGHIFQVVDSFCFVWFRAAYPGEVFCSLTVVAFYRFRRAVMLGCPILLPAESTVVFLLFWLFSVLLCLDFLNRFLFYFFVFRQCGWYG